MPALDAIVPLELQLPDGNTTKYPLAFVKNASGNPVAGSPFSLVSDARGLYSNSSLQMPATDFLAVSYVVYDDAGHTLQSAAYTIVSDVFELQLASGGGGGGGTAPEGVEILVGPPPVCLEIPQMAPTVTIIVDPD